MRIDANADRVIRIVTLAAMGVVQFAFQAWAGTSPAPGPAAALPPDVSPASAQTQAQAQAEPDTTQQHILRHFAREDTLPFGPAYVLEDWIEVRDRRPSLQEILGWCIEREKNRFAHVDDLGYRRRERTMLLFDPDDSEGRRIVTESVSQVYEQAPDRQVVLKLGHRSFDSKEGESKVEVVAETEESTRQLADLPFFFEELSQYDFRIEDRTPLAAGVVYRISFRPKSDFAALPEGWFLINTEDYQIARAEMSWRRNVPYPIFLKAVDSVVLSRERYEVGAESEPLWLTNRVSIDVSLRNLGTGAMPRRFVLDMQIEEMAINAGVPDSVWNQK